MAFWKIYKRKADRERELNAKVSVVHLQKRMDEVTEDLKTSLSKLDLIITKMSDADSDKPAVL